MIVRTHTVLTQRVTYAHTISIWKAIRMAVCVTKHVKLESHYIITMVGKKIIIIMMIHTK